VISTEFNCASTVIILSPDSVPPKTNSNTFPMSSIKSNAERLVEPVEEIAIDNALAYSVVVNSVTYDDWYLATKKEIENSFHLYAGINGHIDTLTSVVVMPSSTNLNSATTVPSNTANHFYWELATRYLQPIEKTIGLSVLYVRNARNLVTAP